MAYCFNDDKSKKSILDAVYPVGAVYISVSSTSPAQLFGGGTWEEIKGRFLVAQGSNGQSGNAALNLSAGATGGETKHGLTANEIPKHTHASSRTQMCTSLGGDVWLQTSTEGSGFGVGLVGATGNNTTNNEAHNNLPPYLSVYMWKRTA